MFWALCGLIRRGPVLISAQGSDFIAACPPSCFSAAVMWLAAPALVTGPCACFWSSGSTASAAVTSTCSRDVQPLQEAQAAAQSIADETAYKQAHLGAVLSSVAAGPRCPCLLVMPACRCIHSAQERSWYGVADQQMHRADGTCRPPSATVVTQVKAAVPICTPICGPNWWPSPPAAAEARHPAHMHSA